MLTANEFDQLIGILPQLEDFARDHQLTSLSLIKIPFNRKPADLYLYYTHNGEIHGLDVTAQIGEEFKELWHIPVDSDIVLAREKNIFDSEIYEKHLKSIEFFLISMDTNQNYITATAAQVADYARRDFEITIFPSTYTDTPENSKRRRISDKKIDKSETPSIASKNIFTQTSSQDSRQSIEEKVVKLFPG